ncbi:MAG: serine hydrolase [Acidobacteria bacterium]|nr:serine hydrolase [Acidobacteriota bacterium]MCA1608502.1 serine hydrolase [Acidobacteriota bacterium]
MKKSALLFAVLLFELFAFAVKDNSQQPEKDFAAAYDAYIRKTMERIPAIPGIAVVVIKDDRPIFLRAYGMADREAGKKADTDTLFYTASSTKSFTAVAAALLDREGKIKLDDSVTKYTTGISFKNPLPEKIKVRDLLTHTSGLRNSPLVFRMAFSGQSEPADMIKIFADATTYSDANYGKYAYDNLGYNIYGLLVQNHLKKKWQDVLQEKIFNPLRMKHTTAYISRAGAKKWTVAAPYTFNAEHETTIRSPLAKTDSNLQSAGGIFTSISDMGTWLTVHMNDGRIKGKQVIPVDIIRAAHTGYTQTTRDAPPFSGNGEYGLGWQIGKYGSEKVHYHHGGFSGYRSHMSFMPERRIGIAVLVNEDFAGSLIADVLATYGYDRLAGKENVDELYVKRLEDFLQDYTKGKQRMQVSAAERGKRVLQLTLPLADYAGRYTNEIFGTIDVTPSGKGLAVAMGNIKIVSTPFTEKDTIRVEMIPPQGETIKFQKSAEGRIESLTYRNVKFSRVN